MDELKFKEKYWEWYDSRSKCLEIRRSPRVPGKYEAVLESQLTMTRSVPGFVYVPQDVVELGRPWVVRVCDLNDDDAVAAGCGSLKELHVVLADCYPDLKLLDWVYLHPSKKVEQKPV